ncbi:DUF2861 family protein [Salinivibrio sharmensis]|uniref:DUF2861 domain-containing protein n=1 Tax=Salinivibrio sharmensis TaxID=390883 RepID=A0ABX3KL38_9GAMM|nr:DUF2861 family protein [Salinivibrio sharmensis]OOE90854.1 hypothetical protein BZG74_01050 [Salinivibrio sharmensis]
MNGFGYHLLLIGCMVCSFSVRAEQAWFPKTPMQETYQALLADRPKVAWQELIFALSQQQIPTERWAKIKYAIINQSDCGQQLTEPNGKGVPQGLTIDFVRWVGGSSLGYEIRLSAEEVERDTLLTLTDPTGQTVVNGILNEKRGYQEVESGTLFTQIIPGIYELKMGGQHYSLVVYGLPRRPWVKLSGHPDQQLAIDLPETPLSCLPAVAHWLWLDDAYRWIEQTPIYLSGRSDNSHAPSMIKLPTSSLVNAEHLSVTVSHFEYQGAIKVNYVEWLALPLPQTVNKE